MVNNFFMKGFYISRDLISKELLNLHKNENVKKMALFISFNIFLCLIYIFVILTLIGSINVNVIN